MTPRDEAEHGWVSGRVRESADGLGSKSPQERAQEQADRLREFAKAEKQEQIGKVVKRGGRL